MNTLLIFFALPIAVVIISIALQKIFRCPFLVAGIIFAIFLVATFIVGDLTFLIATIAYTILAFITAVITKIICRILDEIENRNYNGRICRCNYACSNSNNNGDNESLLTISNTGCNCNASTNAVDVSGSIFPNNNRNSGSFRGCFRRR